MPSSLRRRLAAPLVLALLLAGCAAGPEDGAAGDADGVRFTIEVADEDHDPVFVYLNTESRPVGWIGVLRDGVPEYLEPRCEIPDCGEPPAVCGASIPRVRRIADRGGAGRIEYVWDGVTSDIDDAEECERRVAAPDGEYTARFCYADSARIDSGDPTAEGGAVGRIPDLTCVERTFTLGTDDEVVLSLPEEPS